jgi:hypothetical protein
MMNHPRTIACAALLMTTLLGACGSAHIVRRDARGGELVLDGAYMSRAIEARVLMAEHCGGPFAVYDDPHSGRSLRLIDTPNADQRRATFVCVDEPEAWIAKGRP